MRSIVLIRYHAWGYNIIHCARSMHKKRKKTLQKRDGEERTMSNLSLSSPISGNIHMGNKGGKKIVTLFSVFVYSLIFCDLGCGYLLILLCWFRYLLMLMKRWNGYMGLTVGAAPLCLFGNPWLPCSILFYFFHSKMFNYYLWR